MKTATYVLSIALCIAMASSCSKKEPQDTGGAGGGAAAPAGGAGGGASTGGGAAGTAAGGEVAAIPTVTECPQSLAGSEAVNRIIKRECGTVVVTDTYAVDGGSLTLEAGATLAFKDGAALEVGYSSTSKLIINGTAEAPVTMTSAGDKAAGVWRGIVLHQNANRSRIDHLVIEYAGVDNAGAVDIKAADVVFKNSTIREAKDTGLVLDADTKLAECGGNTFEKMGKAAVEAGPEAAGALGENNTIPKETVINIRGQQLRKAAKWDHQGAPYQVLGNFDIAADSGSRATLEIAAGVEVRFGADVGLGVGYAGPGALRVNGTKEAPVLFTSITDKRPAAWVGIVVYSNGEASFDNAIFEYGGSEEDKGALQVVDSGSASVKNCIFRNNRAGASLLGKVTVVDGNTFTNNEKLALSINAEQYKALGSANTYDKGARILIPVGHVGETATWRTQGAVTELADHLAVDNRAVLTIEEGTQFEVRDGLEVSVGYASEGSLRLQGTKAKPVRFAGTRDEPGAWRGLRFYGNARDAVVQNTVVRDAAEEAGIVASAEAILKVADLVCEKCVAAALAYECGAKVTVGGVKPAAGTPKGVVKPAGCN